MSTAVSPGWLSCTRASGKRKSHKVNRICNSGALSVGHGAGIDAACWRQPVDPHLLLSARCGSRLPGRQPDERADHSTEVQVYIAYPVQRILDGDAAAVTPDSRVSSAV